jgi:hypothetical protein
MLCGSLPPLPSACTPPHHVHTPPPPPVRVRVPPPCAREWEGGCTRDGEGGAPAHERRVLPSLHAPSACPLSSACPVGAPRLPRVAGVPTTPRLCAQSGDAGRRTTGTPPPLSPRHRPHSRAWDSERRTPLPPTLFPRPCLFTDGAPCPTGTKMRGPTLHSPFPPLHPPHVRASGAQGGRGGTQTGRGGGWGGGWCTHADERGGMHTMGRGHTRMGRGRGGDAPPLPFACMPPRSCAHTPLPSACTPSCAPPHANGPRERGRMRRAGHGGTPPACIPAPNPRCLNPPRTQTGLHAKGRPRWHTLWVQTRAQPLPARERGRMRRAGHSGAPLHADPCPPNPCPCVNGPRKGGSPRWRTPHMWTHPRPTSAHA